MKFLREFDAFKHKYLFDANGVPKPIPERMLESWNDVLNAQSHGVANHNLSYDDEASAALGIHQVYWDEGNYTNEYIEMLNLVRDRFIFDYTGIDGLCDFFSPAYFEYEWGMHLEIDYLKHESRYYRDHYVHQIRNMFEMFTLLDRFGYYDKCLEVYSNPESRVGTHIFEAIEQEILSLTDTDRRHYRNIIKMRNDQLKVGCCCVQEEDFHPELRKIMFHYIVYSATIIAALVHDIGYPISYIRRISGGIGKNLPVCRLLTSVDNDYASIEQALQDTLLFNIVPREKIKLRLDSTEEHGAQSAIVLLMYFCQHGGNLSALQHCAIDVASLIIYNHTNKYTVIDKPTPGKPETEPDLHRSDIVKEPLSHIFRMCDDLQEWDRVYFEISDRSNLIVCPICGTPLTRLYNTDTKSPREKKYYCCCKKSDEGYFDTSWFVSRRIINVIACSDMSVVKEGAATKFIMNYDCGALLNIMTFSNSFAKYRAKCVRQLKVLHSYQGRMDSVLFDSFISGNPFAVKIRILEKYGCETIKQDFEKADKPVEFSLLTTTDNVYKEWRKNIAFYLALNKLGSDFKDKCKIVLKGLPHFGKSIKDVFGSVPKEIMNDKKFKDFTKEYNGLGNNTTNTEVLKKYQDFCESLAKWLNVVAKKYLKKEINKNTYKKDFKGIDLSGVFDDESSLSLAADYLLQQVNLIGFEMIEKYMKGERDIPADPKQINIYRTLYENLYTVSDEVLHAVDKYISRSDYEKVKETLIDGRAVGKRIDFFVDYALFVTLWDSVQKCKKYFFKADEPDEKGQGSNAAYAKGNGLLYLGRSPKSANLVLQCITHEGDFDNEYRFRVVKHNGKNKEHDETYPIVSLEVIHDKRKGEISFIPNVEECLQDNEFKNAVQRLFNEREDFKNHHDIDIITVK